MKYTSDLALRHLENASPTVPSVNNRFPVPSVSGQIPDETDQISVGHASDLHRRSKSGSPVCWLNFGQCLRLNTEASTKKPVF